MNRPEFTRKTKADAFTRCGGKCQRCGVKLSYGNIEFHHDKECTFGGTADIGNCVVVCVPCHGLITGQRAAVIAKSNRQRAAHLGLRNHRRGFATNRDGTHKRKMDGTVVRRRAYSEGSL